MNRRNEENKRKVKQAGPSSNTSGIDTKFRLFCLIMTVLLIIYLFASSSLRGDASRYVFEKTVVDPYASKEKGWDTIDQESIDAKYSVRANPAIQQISDWQEDSTSQYTFALKATANTTFETFAEDHEKGLHQWKWPEGDPDAIKAIQDELKSYTLHDNELFHEGTEPVPIYSAIAVAPGNDTYLLDNCGIWIHNAGTYEGKSVDCKCYFIYENLITGWDPESKPLPSPWPTTIPNTIHDHKIFEETNRSKQMLPAIVISARQDGYYGFDTGDMLAELRFMLYTSESVRKHQQDPSAKLESIHVNMSFEISDIDDAQSFGFWPRDGKITAMKADPSGDLYYQHQTDRTANSDLDPAFPAVANYHWVSAQRTSHVQETDNAGKFVFEVEGCSEFHLVNAGWLKINKVSVDDKRYKVGEDRKTQTFDDMLMRYDATIRQFKERRFNPNAFPDSNYGTGTHSLKKASISCFCAYPHKSQISAPELQINTELDSPVPEDGEPVVFLYEITAGSGGSEIAAGTSWTAVAQLSAGQTQVSTAVPVPEIGYGEAMTFIIRAMENGKYRLSSSSGGTVVTESTEGTVPPGTIEVTMQNIAFGQQQGTTAVTFAYTRAPVNPGELRNCRLKINQVG